MTIIDETMIDLNEDQKPHARQKNPKLRTKLNLCIFPFQFDFIQEIAKGLEKQGYALRGLCTVDIYSFCVLERLRLNDQPVTPSDISDLFERLFSDGRKNLLVGDYLINREAFSKYGIYRFFPKHLAELEIDWEADEARTPSFNKL